MTGESSSLEEFERWCRDRHHYHALPLIENFRSFKARMKELETKAKLRQMGQSDDHQTAGN